MANNGKPTRSEKWRNNIKTSMLLNRLGDNALGIKGVDLTQGQIKSIEILLKKTMPDLKSVEHSGLDGAPIEHNIKVEYVGAVKKEPVND